jgi:hypothetical protein
MAAEFYLRPLPIEVAASGPPAHTNVIDQTLSPANTSKHIERPLSGLFNPAQPGPGNKGIEHYSTLVSSSPRLCPPVRPSASHRPHQTPILPPPVCINVTSLHNSGSSSDYSIRSSAPLLYLHPPRCKHCSRHRYSNRAPRFF